MRRLFPVIFRRPAGLAVPVLAGATLSLSAADLATNSPPAVFQTASPANPTPIQPAGDAVRQNWNWHVQQTTIVQGYPGFSSKYAGPDSLPAGGQTRESVSLDLMAGVRLWPGAEAHVDGLMWQGFGLNNTLGIEGFPNGEAFRLGTAVPNGSLTRLFIRQTIGLGGGEETVADDELNLAGQVDVSRLTFTLGRFSPTDIFDNNTYAGDPRTQFLNWALMANEAWDYPADAIGYTTGLAIELRQPSWTLRYGFFQMPRYSNSLTAEDRVLTWPYDGTAQDGPLLQAWGMVTELERRYQIRSHPGALRLLAYLNRANMGDYAAAVNDPTRPADINATAAFRYKYGVGINWEQEITGELGTFSRLGWSDGRNQGWVFSDVDYTATAGLSLKGGGWRRPGDTVGLAGVLNGISSSHQAFLAAGGTGILAGDGALDYGWEKIVETYYDLNLDDFAHATLDYQFIDNPAFNRARGPVSVLGARLHWEF